jgi:hypothetical protein
MATVGVLRGLDDRAAVGTVNVQAERVQPQRHHERPGTQPDDAVGLIDGEAGALGQRVHADREGRRLFEHPATTYRDPDHVVANDVDAAVASRAP